jgi:putative transcriptional regulator
MIRHHPSASTLMSCAASTLSVLHQSVVAVHLAQCPACRAQLRFGEELGGVLLDAVQPKPLSDDALEHTLTRLDRMPPATEALPPMPTTLAALESRGRWRWIGLGIRLMPLAPRDASGTRLDLIRVAPGTALPQHAHTGPESTCVLQGAFADETGEYHVGDIAEGDVGLDHRPAALAGGDCICLIATTGYLRADSLVVRLLQPIFGV